jgi:protein involved in polysaccharide export with SLBB domain
MSDHSLFVRLRALLFPAIAAASLVASGPVAVAQTSGIGSEAQTTSPDLQQASLAPGVSSGIDANTSYKLGSGDRIRVSVFNQKEMTDVYQLDGRGHIAFPLIGDIDANGLTPKQLEVKLARTLSPDYVKNPHVSIVVLTARPFYILGEVTKPGSYPYVSGMTVLTAAAQAGGFTYRANEDTFDLQRPDATGKKKTIDAKPDTPVQPGDIIKVNERWF